MPDKSMDSCSQHISVTNLLFPFFTGRNEVLAKVIFSQAPVIYSVHGGGGGSGPGKGVLQFFGGVSPIFQGVSKFSGGGVSTGIRSTFGRYASYWNAFLFNGMVSL